MVGNIYLVAAILTAFGTAVLLPSMSDDARPSLLSVLAGEREASQPDRLRVGDVSLSAENASSSSSSASASSSVSVSGDKQEKNCTAQATAKAQADGVENSDHQMEVSEGEGCSAKARSRAVVKPRKKPLSE